MKSALLVKLPARSKSQFDEFLRKLQATLLDADKIEVESSTIFNKATTIIDQLWQLVDLNLLTLEQEIVASILDG